MSRTQNFVMNRLDDAERALCWLRGWVQPVVIHSELEEIKAVVKASTWTATPGSSGCCDHFKNNLDKYKKATFVRPFLLVCSCFFIGNFTGVASLATYAVNIFSSLGSPIDRYYATCMLGVAQIIGSLACAGVIHSTGKRPLVIISTIGNGIFFSGVAFYAYYYAGVLTLDNGAAIEANFPGNTNTLSWVPLVCLIGGALCAYTGARLLPWIIIGEIFPADIRALATGIAASMFYVFGFAANKTYYTLVDYLTVPGIYWFHSAVAIMAAVFYYFCLPETEGWSLHEVGEHFAGKRNLIHAGRRKKSVQMSREAHDNLGLSLNELNNKV